MFKSCLVFTASIALLAQTNPINQIEVQVQLDSGPVVNRTAQRGVIFADVLVVDQAAWLRIQFDELTLGESSGEPTLIRLTSMKDGAFHIMNGDHVEQWQYTSAYLNGDAVLVEIEADADAEPSTVRVTQAWAGTGYGNRSICGSVDDRLPSSDPRVVRIEPIGCTGWMIHDLNKCFLTAGHCDGAMSVVEFNVPLSDPFTGADNHPPPEDQYPIDASSVQSNGGLGIGNDWAYFGTFPNTNTGLTAYQAQGSAFNLVAPPPPAGQNIRITGHGVNDSSRPVPTEWRAIQRTHLGPFNSNNGNALNYATDTTGGNSGSPVIHEESGNAIGIHTHAGCSSGGNNGTSSLHPGLQNALANPIGVCACNTEIGLLQEGYENLVEVSGNGDAFLDPQEVWEFSVKATNTACSTLAVGVTGVMQLNPSSTANATINNPLVSFGDIPGQSTVVSAAPFQFEIPAMEPCGGTLIFEMIDLQTTSRGGSFPGNEIIRLPVGDVQSTDILSEGFGSGIPGSWTVTHAGTGAGENATWNTNNPGNRPFLDAPFAVCDSGALGGGFLMDETLAIPAQDVTGYDRVWLTFSHFFWFDPNNLDEICDVDVRSSLTDGASWVNVATFSDGSAGGEVTIDLTAFAAADLEVRFRYHNAQNETFWGIDDVRIIGDTFECEPVCATPGDVDNAIANWPLDSILRILQLMGNLCP